MKARGVLLAGNWKMNHLQKETTAFLDALAPALKSTANQPAKQNCQMRIYVPALSLETAIKKVKTDSIPLQIGCQNAHYEKAGAFTGEVSVPMLKEIGIDQVLVGHSERRQLFGETNTTVLKRTVSALEQGMEVLVCVGETLDERNSGQMQSVLQAQLEQLVTNETVIKAFGNKLHIAYEPVWAIGTGVTASPAQAAEAHAYIRQLLQTKVGPAFANATRILYGGSVTPANFKELLSCSDIDGGLVGGASLKIESWTALWALI
jgi:triosephosphate isomerase